MTQRLRAGAALLLLLTALIGLPVALVETIGNPLTAWPDLAAGDLSSRTVLAILAAIAWLAWASFAAGFAIEIADTVTAKITNRAPRRWRIPALGLQQDLARALLAAVFVLGPTTAGLALPHSVAAAPAPVPRPVLVSQQFGHETAGPVTSTPGPASSRTAPPGHDRSPARITYTVPASGGLRTLWDLAEHYLGAGQRWPEIWEHNHDRTQADGAIMTSPQLLRPGWTVLIPADDVPDGRDLVVKPGDTLSDIAAANGISDWHELWALNTGRSEPGGETFTDPDLIKPGWIISTLSHATETDGGPTAETSQPSAPPASPVPMTPPSAPAPSPSTAEPPAESPPPRPAEPRHEQEPVPASTARHSVQVPVVFGAGGGMLLAGAALTALHRHRRRQNRWRSPGRQIATTPSALAPTEKTLLATGGAAIADVDWLDQALRGLAHAFAGTSDARMPDVVAARLAADDLQLLLAAPDPRPPKPWQPADDGQRWTLARDADPGYDPAERAYHFAPYPTLVSVGYTESGENWLIDLERIAALSLTGDPERCLNLARFLAAELAHNTWSEQLDVTLVGFGDEMAGLNPARLNYAGDLELALSGLHNQHDQLSDLADASHVDALAGRVHNVAGDAWTPHVLLIDTSQQNDNRERIDALLEAMRARSERQPVAVVLADGDVPASPTRWQVHLTGDGRIQIPALGLDLVAQQLPADEAGPLSQLLAFAAAATDEATPDTAGDRPHSADTDRPREAHDAVTAEVDEPSPGNAIRPPTLIAVPRTPDAGGAVRDTATALPDLHRSAPKGDDAERSRTDDVDPTLDDDLAAWKDPACPRPKLRLLGAPRATAIGSLPPDRPRTDFYTEVVAFLATRTGTTVSQLAAALWPNDPEMASKTTPRQAVTVVRKWLGTNPDTGHDYLPYGGDGSVTGTYRIDGTLIDADLVRRLRNRGVSRGSDADGLADLINALELVDGIPFDRSTIRARRSPGGYLIEPYSWLVDTPLDHQYAAMVTDLAHLAAPHLIDAGDATKAAWAAQVALRAGDCSDTPLLDLVAASLAQDQRAAAEQYAQRIMGNHDADIEEDLPPNTYKMLIGLLR